MSKCELQPSTAFLCSMPRARFTTRPANCCKETRQRRRQHWKAVSMPIGPRGLDFPCRTILDCSVTLSSKSATLVRLIACSVRRLRPPKGAVTAATKRNCIASKERWHKEKGSSQRYWSSTSVKRSTLPGSRAVRRGSLGLRLASRACVRGMVTGPMRAKCWATSTTPLPKGFVRLTSARPKHSSRNCNPFRTASPADFSPRQDDPPIRQSWKQKRDATKIAPEGQVVPALKLASGRDRIIPHYVCFQLKFVKSMLENIPDADNPHKPPPLLDRRGATPPLRHEFHDMIDAVVRRAVNDRL